MEPVESSVMLQMPWAGISANGSTLKFLPQGSSAAAAVRLRERVVPFCNILMKLRLCLEVVGDHDRRLSGRNLHRSARHQFGHVVPSTCSTFQPKGSISPQILQR
jgi:hypothetical protein